jgi:DNA-binding transcriptional LysR family regulator
VEAFVTIVRRASFTGAAAALHLSQPAVSRRIDLLEQELAAPVFERTRAGVRLTDAGRAFLPYAEMLGSARRSPCGASARSRPDARIRRRRRPAAARSRECAPGT